SNAHRILEEYYKTLTLRFKAEGYLSIRRCSHIGLRTLPTIALLLSRTLSLCKKINQYGLPERRKTRVLMLNSLASTAPMLIDYLRKRGSHLSFTTRMRTQLIFCK